LWECVKASQLPPAGLTDTAHAVAAFGQIKHLAHNHSLKLGRRPCLSIHWPEFAFNVAAQPTMSVELALAA
jgi:hypothetical protein